MPTALGIRAGEIWAYKRRLTGPLVRARVLKPGAHYEAAIQIIILEGPERGTSIWTKRARLPCKWDDREAWLEAHPGFARELPPEPQYVDAFDPPGDMLFAMGEAALRRIVRDELQAILNMPPKIAYTRREAARAVGLSETSISNAVQNGDLVASYYNSKPLFTREELSRWIASLPAEPR
jgi:hypothetical protein